jgi:hypothetical protein
MTENLAFQGLVGLSLAMYLWLISAGLTIIFGISPIRFMVRWDCRSGLRSF